MLRLIVLLLLLANGGYYAWSQGLLLPWGFGPAQESEPQRLAQQIRPEAVHVLPAAQLQQAEAVAAQAPRPPECLATEPLDDHQLAAVRNVLQGWPGAAWTLEAVAEPARWIIYMGRYADVEQVARKSAELRQLGISFEATGDPALEPGLSLGSFASEAAASERLATLGPRGVRTARVLQQRPEQRGQRLVLPAVDDTLRPRLAELKTVLATKPLRPCR